MIRFKTKLINIMDAPNFVQCAQSIPTEVLVRSGNAVVSGKSLFGIFALNLSEPITVEVADEQALSKFPFEKTDIEKVNRVPHRLKQITAILNRYKDKISEEDFEEATDLLSKIKENR